MKEIVLALAMLLTTLFPALSQQTQKPLPAPTVFAQMDSYVAAQVDTTCPMSFYLIFREDRPFQGREISSIVLDEAREVLYQEYMVSESKHLTTCNGVSIVGKMYFSSAGHYELSSIKIHFFDGSMEEYPIGRLVVDVYDDVGSEVLYTWSTPALSSLPDCFGFTYDLADATERDVTFVRAEMNLLAEVKLLKAEIETSYASGKTALVAEFEFASEKPVVYRFVLPRVFILVDGKENVIYPKVGCFCGGAQVTEEHVLAVYEAWYPEK